MKNSYVIVALSLASCGISKVQLKSRVHLGGMKVSDIQKAWITDSCGSIVRDSIMNIFIEEKSLYGLAERDIYSLLGKPYYSAIQDDGDKLVRYVILGNYLPELSKCEPNYAYKVLDMTFDKKTLKVNYYDTWTE